MDQMAERWLVEIMQHVSQFFVARPPRSESGSIGLAQCGYERIAVFLADFAVLVSVTAVEAGFLRHDGFLCLWMSACLLIRDFETVQDILQQRRYSASNTSPAEPKIGLIDAILISVGH